MTLPESDTTPLAITAALLHEGNRSVDLIRVGTTRSPWGELSSRQKDAAIGHVLSSIGKTFEEYYEGFTQAFHAIGREVADPSDETDELVQLARMRFAIINCLLPTGVPEEADAK